MLFNISIDHLDDGIESTLTKSAVNTKLGDEVDTSEGKAILQKDVDWLIEWASNNSMKFKKEKFMVPHLDHKTKEPSAGSDLSVWVAALQKATWKCWWTAS